MNNSEKIKNNVTVIVPFYNESSTISEVIEKTLPFVDLVIAVNDGSNDNSLDKIKNFERLELISFKKNNGKGFALRAGFDKAVNLGYNKIVTLDADLQHNPAEINKLLALSDKFDIVIGNRLKDLKSMPFLRKVSNRLTSFLLTLKTGQKIIDSQCGFRVYNSNVLEKIKTKENGFEAETEILLLAAKNGFKIGFADISTIYGNEKSKMKPIKTTVGFIKLLLTLNSNVEF